MTKFHLLIGAGFSRNWGGWLSKEVFEYLLGCPEVIGDGELRRCLWTAQLNGSGFEGALSDLDSGVAGFHDGIGSPYIKLQRAILSMFSKMNSALGNSNWEFHLDRRYSVSGFLALFDNVFTLNQDTLVEHHYFSQVSTAGSRRWAGLEMPGMQLMPRADPLYPNSFATSTWVPQGADKFRVSENVQPFFKLHGSSNWRHKQDSALMIIGGAKANNIAKVPVLSWYADEFRRRLLEPPSRLMVIGYGFGDTHINQILIDAVGQGLKLFVIAPEGAEIVHAGNQTRYGNRIAVATEMEHVIERSLIGASRRPLSEIFGGDTAEYQKVMRFFSA